MSQLCVMSAVGLSGLLLVWLISGMKTVQWR
jgi:hypothetical protein